MGWRHQKIGALACSEMKRDTKYLGKVPWLFTSADTIEGATECVIKIEKNRKSNCVIWL